MPCLRALGAISGASVEAPHSRSALTECPTIPRRSGPRRANYRRLGLQLNESSIYAAGHHRCG
jgi:hypothetical protein